jgi:hypothetical protein
MNVSRRDSTAVQRGLGVVILILFVLALERFVNAAMAGSEVGTSTAWIVGMAFALTGMILGLLLLTLGTCRPDPIDPDTHSSHGSPER